MNTQGNIPEQVPSAQHPGKRATEGRDPRARNDIPGLLMNQRDSAQDLRPSKRRIVLGQGIASRDPLAVALLDQTMNEEPAVPYRQHDVAQNQVFAGRGLDAENIPGPDRRKHAGSECLQADGAARAENFSRKFKLMIPAGLCHNRHEQVKLRSLPIEAALKFGGAYLATGQSHCLENPLVPEPRFLIWFLPRWTVVGYVVLVSIRVFLHKSPRVLDWLWGQLV